MLTHLPRGGSSISKESPGEFMQDGDAAGDLLTAAATLSSSATLLPALAPCQMDQREPDQAALNVEHHVIARPGSGG